MKLKKRFTKELRKLKKNKELMSAVAFTLFLTVLLICVGVYSQYVGRSGAIFEPGAIIGQCTAGSGYCGDGETVITVPYHYDTTVCENRNVVVSITISPSGKQTRNCGFLDSGGKAVFNWQAIVDDEESGTWKQHLFYFTAAGSNVGEGGCFFSTPFEDCHKYNVESIESLDVSVPRVERHLLFTRTVTLEQGSDSDVTGSSISVGEESSAWGVILALGVIAAVVVIFVVLRKIRK